jgi:hypothetical protein
MYPQRVAGLENRDVFAQLRPFEFFNRAHVNT